MITCTLNGKKYTVDYITGRALREMEPAAKMYGRIVSLSNAALKGELPEEAKELSIPEAMDEMIRWFCILFGNQFTPDDVLDYYPVDRLMHDIALALMAVQTQTTSILDEFPIDIRIGRRKRSSRRHRPPDAAGFHLLDVQQPAGERLGGWTRSTGWTCRASCACGRGTQGGSRTKRNLASGISTRCGRE